MIDSMLGVIIYSMYGQVCTFLQAGVLGWYCLCLVACFDPMAAPSCERISDCPAGFGYSICKKGRCFVSSPCVLAAPRNGDGCCPSIEGDRTDDNDCLILDHFLDARIIKTPAFADSGDIFVTGTWLDEEQKSQLVLWRISQQGEETGRLILSPGENVFAPLLGNDVYVASDIGVTRVQGLGEMSVREHIVSPPVSGGICLAGTQALPLIVWLTQERELFFYAEYEHRLRSLNLSADGRFDGQLFAPLASADGTLVFVASSEGTIAQINCSQQIPRMDALGELDGPLQGPLVHVRDFLVVLSSSGVLQGFSVKQQNLEEVWALEIGTPSDARMLVNQEGNIVVLLADSSVVLVEVLKDTAREVAKEYFGGLVHQMLLTREGRAVGIGDSTVFTLPWESSIGSFFPGLFFDAGLLLTDNAVLWDHRLLLTTTSLRILGYVLMEGDVNKGLGSPLGDRYNHNRMGSNGGTYLQGGEI